MVLDDGYNCILRNIGQEETSFCLFFECPFSQRCWDSMPINWNLNLPHLDMMIEARTTFGHTISREITITAC